MRWLRSYLTVTSANFFAAFGDDVCDGGMIFDGEAGCVVFACVGLGAALGAAIGDAGTSGGSLDSGGSGIERIECGLFGGDAEVGVGAFATGEKPIPPPSKLVGSETGTLGRDPPPPVAVVVRGSDDPAVSGLEACIADWLIPMTNFGC